MKYIIGIDGGGTKTDCAASDLNGNVLFDTKGKPSNFLVEGTEKVSEAILSLINTCKENLKFDYSDIEIIIIGTAGAGRKTDAERLKTSFLNYSKNHAINFKKIVVESDAVIALEGAFSGKPGAILIAGTGSIMFGKDLEGKIHRVGGFGRKIGDEGSGYNLGRKGLNAVSKEFDRRGKPTLITNYLKEKFAVNSPEILISEVYGNEFDIASIAPLVISAAEKNDETALKIIDEETNELLLHISSMKQKLNLPEFNLCLIGGLINKENFYSKRLKEKIIKNFPYIKLQLPENSPVIGAVLMAKRFLK
jgi:N-acetylglucosamine kinase-like BadF-type ATPase